MKITIEYKDGAVIAKNEDGIFVAQPIDPTQTRNEQEKMLKEVLKMKIKMDKISDKKTKRTTHQ